MGRGGYVDCEAGDAGNEGDCGEEGDMESSVVEDICLEGREGNS